MSINRIGLKLGAAVIVLMIVILVSSGLAVDRLFTNFYDAQMKDNTQEIAAHFATMAESNDTSSQSMIRAFAKFSDVKVFWLNDEGRILTLPGEKQPNLSFIRSRDTRRLLSGHSVAFQNHDVHGNRFYVVGKPIQIGKTTGSAIYIVSSMKKIDDSLQRLRNLLVLSGLGAFFLALGMILIMSKLLSRPLLRMQQMTDKMAKGNWDTRLQVGSRDEIGMLGHSINDLAASLQRYRDTRRAFFSNISHELRTPVTYLQGYAKVLTDGLVDSDKEKKQYLSIIYQESVRLEHLINDLFDLSKMEEGQIKLNMEWMDLKITIKTTVQKVKLKAESKRLSLQLDLQDQVPLIRGDRKRMEQVLLNLLENAIRYTEKGSVLVRLTGKKEATVLSVSDTGIGIPKEELPYIFERFYRVEKSRAREYGGTGLGLSIVKKYVEMQDGTVRVDSQMGVGTTFTLIFTHEKKQRRDGMK
ncbi:MULTISPECIES: sensor histidine kinase [Sporolactobacillus]|uniref:Circadian input-output histidine kinase CikA n=2 Tax=Sporolactobacillus inulinus TaxID=2078 RepID=A0A0U1QM79_9BACL|nr:MULTISPECIES: HAMP domain-containing sensor histidine kinase [Sporolactobacillus]KLI01917.1 transcriptional regulator [Sporolactobacillus inulinus CASD]MCQ2010355.1 HAMP domain-containing histidine kinase [Sporolactobacillus sp. STSJ-5]GEB76745.1 two-component sensor histidine kinase [Sporolactobacillus inulinus]